MRKKEYTKIKLRDFRQRLTTLKDSLSYGEMYEITQRGKSIAYFIPSEYEVKVTKKKSKTIELLKAVETKYKDYKDLLQFFSAVEFCDTILTRNKRDFEDIKRLTKCKINIISPTK